VTLPLLDCRPQALRCLNHMIHDAMRHLPNCLEYLAQLRDPEIFRFCAIPQVMALATLQQCYGNGSVFEGIVKLRRGQTAKVLPLRSVSCACMRWLARLDFHADVENWRCPTIVMEAAIIWHGGCRQDCHWLWFPQGHHQLPRARQAASSRPAQVS
jgi:hypothetical protein